jgi:hypothetical protein
MAGENESGDSDPPDRTRSKVGRLVREYDLEGLPAELEARWTGESGERTSLRDLADLFNRRLLERALERAGRSSLEANVDQLYRALTDDDVSTGVRTRTRRELERDGIDVDALESDFVSHQAIHTHLTKYRGVDHARDEDLAEKSLQRLRRLQGRTEAVTTDTVERLIDREEVEGDEVRVLVNVQVLCQNCGTSYDATEFIEGGGCDCS